MEQLDLKNYLYHGIIDWLNYDKNFENEEMCLYKLESILKTRHIYMPIEFK